MSDSGRPTGIEKEFWDGICECGHNRMVHYQGEHHCTGTRRDRDGDLEDCDCGEFTLDDDPPLPLREYVRRSSGATPEQIATVKATLAKRLDARRSMQREILALRAEVEQLRKDAERYRYIKSCNPYPTDDLPPNTWDSTITVRYNTGTDIDFEADVDAEMAAAVAKEGK